MAIEQAGYLAVGGQIVEASIVGAPKQLNTKEEKGAIKTNRISGRLGEQAAHAAAEGA